jgi:hypothetical protein
VEVISLLIVAPPPPELELPEPTTVQVGVVPFTATNLYKTLLALLYHSSPIEGLEG